MIKAENLSFIYPKSKRMVLHDFSFSLEAGRVYGLLGRNVRGEKRCVSKFGRSENI